MHWMLVMGPLAEVLPCAGSEGPPGASWGRAGAEGVQLPRTSKGSQLRGTDRKSVV